MKRILACLIGLFALVSTSCAQTENNGKEEKGTVVQMNKQMFLDQVFDYTTGASTSTPLGAALAEWLPPF